MSSQGPNDGSTFVSDGSGDNVWNSPENAKLADGVNSTFEQLFGAGLVSDYLLVTGFGFSIPSTATINGIKVEVKAQDKSSITPCTNYSVFLFKDGVVFSNEDKALGDDLPVEAPAYITFGAPTDLWGTSITYANINDVTFGVGYKVLSNDPIDAVANVDHIRITVYYTDAPPASIKSMQTQFLSLFD